MNYPKGLFQGWEIAIAKKYVRQFRSTCQCLGRDFEDDLVDECLKHWFSQRDTVKPEEEEKRRAYMVTIVRNYLCNIVEGRRTKKRNEYYQAVSLNQFLEENPNSSILAHNPPDEFQLPELRAKLTNIFQRLNPQQKKVFQALQDGDLSVTTISVRLKVHRATVHNEIKRMREIFESEGLREYLP